MPFLQAATQGYCMVAPPSGKIGTKQQQPQQQRSRCINVRHADGHSRAAPTCSDTRVAAGLHPSFVMCVEDRLPGSGIWIGTKEPCSAVPHRNRDQHRNDAGSSLVLTKTPCSRHRLNPLTITSRAPYKTLCRKTGPACGHTWFEAPSRHAITIDSRPRTCDY